MQELGLIPLVNGDATRVSHSALPECPIAPGRLRLLTPGALHRLAIRLDGGQLPPLGHARPL
jgi:hypothetical protein